MKRGYAKFYFPLISDRELFFVGTGYDRLE